MVMGFLWDIYINVGINVNINVFYGILKGHVFGDGIIFYVTNTTIETCENSIAKHHQHLKRYPHVWFVLRTWGLEPAKLGMYSTY
jgi:hypothetical protein